jgi:hypothetical protein
MENLENEVNKLKQGLPGGITYVYFAVGQIANKAK